MKKLSKEAESKLMDCIRDVAANVAEGQSPTEAVTKIAESSQLSPQFIRLVCQAYNTGATTRQREGNDDVLGKMAEFAIADPETAVSKVYPKLTAKQACSADGDDVDPVYSKAPVQAVDKSALYRPLPRIQLEPYTGEAPSAEIRRLGEWHRQKKAAENSRLDVLRLERELTNTLGELGEYFKQSAVNRESFRTVERNAELLFGKTGAELMTYVRERNRMTPKTLDMEKPAGFGKVNIEHQPYSYFVQVVKLGQALVSARKVAKQAAEVAAPRTFPKAAATDPAIPTINYRNDPRPSLLKESNLASVLAEKGLGAIGSRLAPKPTAGLLEDSWLDLEDPKHENEMRQNASRAMLTDLLANDEVISGYPREEVMKHYNEISQLHPHAATLPLLMRPQLRKALTAGGLEPFETGEMAKTEQTINKTKNLTPRSQGLLDAPESVLG